MENDKLSGAVGILYKSPVADFKTQVKQWLAAEAKAVQNLGENAIHDRHNRTVLVVSFGVWDLWNMIERNYETATKSVDYSVEVIMEQLDMLSENWGSDDLKIILTLVPDVTFQLSVRLGISMFLNTRRLLSLLRIGTGRLKAQWRNGGKERFICSILRHSSLISSGTASSTWWALKNPTDWVGTKILGGKMLRMHVLKASSNG